MLNTILKVENLSYTVPTRKVLKNINFNVQKNQFTIVVGENGAGKTTLLQLLMGIIEPSEGKVQVQGKEPHQDPFLDRQEIGYIAEKITPPVDWSVDDFLVFNRYFYKNYSLETESRLLKDLRLQRDWRVGSLSAGQIRRVQVVGVLSNAPKLIIIDEITAVLDIVGRSKFMRALQELREKNQTTIVMATNILDDVDTYATNVVLLHEGEVMVSQTKEEIIRSTGAVNLTRALAGLIEKSEEVSS
jgi:ABC-type multidrug transport system ATPase subunit